MMLLPVHKSEYLLNVSLESLHSESIEWLQKVDFWRDEIAFFYKFIFLREIKTDLPAPEVGKIENKLVYFKSDILDKLRDEVVAHEQILAQLFMLTPLEEEQGYRHKHRMLSEEIYGVEEQVKILKTEVFSLLHS